MPASAKTAAKKAPAKKPSTPAKPAAKKSVKAATQPAKTATQPAKKVAAKPAAAEKSRVAKRGNSGVSAERRRNYIEIAAYYIAERRGFNGGDPLADWAAAEVEIDRLLAEGRLSP